MAAPANAPGGGEPYFELPSEYVNEGAFPVATSEIAETTLEDHKWRGTPVFPLRGLVFVDVGQRLVNVQVDELLDPGATTEDPRLLNERVGVVWHTSVDGDDVRQRLVVDLTPLWGVQLPTLHLLNEEDEPVVGLECPEGYVRVAGYIALDGETGKPRYYGHRDLELAAAELNATVTSLLLADVMEDEAAAIAAEQSQAAPDQVPEPARRPSRRRPDKSQ